MTAPRFASPCDYFIAKLQARLECFHIRFAAGRAGEPGGRGAQSGIMLHAARFAQRGTQMIDDGDMTRIVLGLAIVGVVGIATVGVLSAYRMLREIEVALDGIRSGIAPAKALQAARPQGFERRHAANAVWHVVPMVYWERNRQLY